MEELEPSGLDELLHGYLEATAVAFADRGRYLGDPACTPMPRAACSTDLRRRTGLRDRHDHDQRPLEPGDVASYDGVCEPRPAATGEQRPDSETTNLTVADRWGNVVEYTLTIEQTGGAGLLVPNRGFLLDNEVEVPDDPHPQRGPFLVPGSPGGASIITTVLQVTSTGSTASCRCHRRCASHEHPNATPRPVGAEQAFINEYGGLPMPFGHEFLPRDHRTCAAEIGALNAIEFRGNRRMIAVAEPPAVAVDRHWRSTREGRTRRHTYRQTVSAAQVDGSAVSVSSRCRLRVARRA